MEADDGEHSPPKVLLMVHLELIWDDYRIGQNYWSHFEWEMRQKMKRMEIDWNGDMGESKNVAENN